jgi:V/A-type H+-transporting ATPase subunit D
VAKVKHTKNGLKLEREALQRYTRYLPMLQLKKQQLQVELRQVAARIEENEGRAREARARIAPWVRLLAEPIALSDYLRVVEVRESAGSIAGVAIPLLEEVRFERTLPDLYATPPWLDDALLVLEGLTRLGIERRLLDEQRRLLAAELRTTTQRVNLFEHVKIPEAEHNIRVIRIFLGDESTAGVVRAKIAKTKSPTARGAA